ncbi:MAG: GTPase [Candidatus Nitrosocaldaceae archaeon]|nr:MAG: GTPase [Candidatus Nitrosocaldaceae archaeon]
MYAIFLTGTAGSGKSLLASRLKEWYEKVEAYPAILNLDPGVVTLPYEPDIDIRDHINIDDIMGKYDLGPNGALIMANDMIGYKLYELQQSIDELNPDYLIIDTPGQVELFAYRASGQYIVNELIADEKANIFLFDSILASLPINYVSIMLLASSIRLRLKIAQINVLSKIDMLKDKNMLKWMRDYSMLENELYKEDNELSLLAVNVTRVLKQGFASSPLPVSSITYEGLANLIALLSRIFKGGEELEY